MKDSVPVLFFTTSACHLCEQAKEVIGLLPAEFSLSLEPLDIVEDEQLLDRYGTRIPVLYDPETTLELGWPFDRELARQYFQACASGRKRA